MYSILLKPFGFLFSIDIVVSMKVLYSEFKTGCSLFYKVLGLKIKMPLLLQNSWVPDARHSVVNFHGCQAPKVWVLTHALSFYIFVLTCTVSFGIPSRSTLTFSLSASALVIAIRCCLAHKLWNEIKRKDAWRSEMFCLYLKSVYKTSGSISWFSRNIAASMYMSTEKIYYLSNLPLDPN